MYMNWLNAFYNQYLQIRILPKQIIFIDMFL